MALAIRVTGFNYLQRIFHPQIRLPIDIQFVSYKFPFSRNQRRQCIDLAVKGKIIQQ